MKNKRWLVPLTITFILLGFIISTQLQTQNRLDADLSSQTSADLTIIFKNLSEKRLALAQEIADVERTIQTYKESYADESELLNQVNSEIAKLELLVGTVSVQGPGIEVTIDESANGYFIDKDIVTIINELWAAGAEAVSLNDQRVTLRSHISSSRVLDTNYYTHNGQLLELPIVIKAIGDSATLDKGLTLPGGIIDNLTFFRVLPTIEIKETIVIPALEQTPTVRYGKIPSKLSP